jgi:hypothetical protein
VGNIFLTFGRKRLLVARATAEGDDHNLSLLLRYSGSGQHSGAEQCATQGDTGGTAQELAPGEAQLPGKFPGTRGQTA